MTTYNIDWQSGGDEGIPGKQDILLSPKTVDSTSTSLRLTGKGVPNYGEIQQENFIRLMEHFASENPPANPTIGQIWYNTAESILYLRVDPALVGDSYARYYPQSPAAWVQIWPSRNTFASLAEYSAMALTINRIIGAPSVFGSDPVVENNQYGWGQTDLVPEYDGLNALKPGFNPLVFPQQFDNNAWVILLSRLRKALRHVGLNEGDVSPVGFINDGRPPVGGNALANNYNDNPAATNLPDYEQGWGTAGTLTLHLYYAATLSAIGQLTTNRFMKAPLSTASSVLAATTRTTPWSNTVQHNVTLTFASQNAARAYFNSGGSVQFNFSLSGYTPDAISVNWDAFLSSVTGMHFDYKGVRTSGFAYENPQVGFYDLSGTFQTILEKKRNYNNMYSGIVDSGLRIEARTESTLAGELQVIFRISFVEDSSNVYEGSGNVTGTLSSQQVLFKAGPLNVNSPVIAFPTFSATAIE